MRVRSVDELTKALRQLQQAPRSEDPAALHPTISFDLGELFLSELKTRRKRLRQWIRLLSDEVTATRMPPARARARKRKSRTQAA